MKKIIAIVLFKLGFKYYTSCDLADNLIYGYGKLYTWGFKYELPKKYIKEIKQAGI